MIKRESVKKVSTIFMMIFLATSLIILLVWSLFAYWRSSSTPVTYRIQGVVPNKGHIIEECDASQLTVLQNPITGQIKYECGNLGRLNEVITIDE